MFLFLLLLCVGASATPSYVISDGTQLIMVDPCGALNATGVQGVSVYSSDGPVFFASGNDIKRISSTGAVLDVCSSCIYSPDWIVHGSDIIGWDSNGINFRPLTTGTGPGLTVYAPSGSNIVKAVAVVSNLVYWVEEVTGGNDQLWSATYPEFETPTYNPNGLLVHTYTKMAVQGENVLMAGDTYAETFEARDEVTSSVRSRQFTNVPSGSTLRGAAAARRSWVYVNSAGDLAERFSGQCLKNVTEGLPTTVDSVASFDAVECPTSTCWIAPQTQTSDSSIPTPSILIWVALFGVLCIFL